MKNRENFEELPAISQWLITARRQSGKSQEQVASGAEIDTTYVSKIELGQKTPSRKVVLKLAKSLEPDNADEHTAATFLNAGLSAAGFAIVPLDTDAPAMPSPIPTSVIEFYEGDVTPEERAFVEQTIAMIGNARLRLPARLGQ